MELIGIDILITGHTHKPKFTKPAKIFFDTKNNTVTMRPFQHVVATSWLNYGGYALRKMYRPTSYMEQELTLCVKEKKIKFNGS
jgi:UDP-2,3-diacylglucosamine pyrophosphatase LpxH